MITRRSFLLGTAAGAAGLYLPGTAAAARRILGAGEDIRIGVVGLNGRGGSHIGGFSKVPGVRVVALCDVDERVMASRAAKLAAAGNTVATFTDIRKMLEDDGIDAISIATQNHWHSLMGIWACQAGKDVYVEKPVSHNVWEGRQLVRAAERYGRIVQCGTQSRSNPGLMEALRYVRDG